jgi:dihydrolipoamide dehydrogenase
MDPKSFDVIVIGGGPGGYPAAIRSAQLGKQVALVERDALGGICLNWGCIPTKALLKNAEILQLMRRSDDFGIHCENLRFDFSKVVRRSREVSARIVKGVEYLMKKNHIEVYDGFGQLAGGGKVLVLGEGGTKIATLSGANIVLATGARPKSLPGVEIDGERLLSSREAMVLEALPKSLLVLGGGAIGVEFAYFFNAFGVEVTIVEMLDHLLPVEDAEVAQVVEKSFTKSGIKVMTKTKVESLELGAESVAATLAGPQGQKTVQAERGLIALGVRGNLENLGLESAQVQSDRGFIKVGADCQTSAPHIYAIGDVIGPPWLAHVATAEGILAAEAIAGLKTHPIDYSAIPGCTYCQPQVASVGWTEEKARAEGRQLKIGKFPFRVLGKAQASGETEGFVKLIFDAKYEELLGAHIVGSEATELIAELGLAKLLEATRHEVHRAIHAHPTLSEAIMEAAGAAGGDAIHL